MRIAALLIFASLLASIGSPSFASDPDAGWTFEDVSGSKIRNASLEFDTAFRRDKLDWNIAFDPTGLTPPNVLSELTWRNLQAFEFEARGDVETRQNIYVKAMLGYGWIFDGDNQDSDYGSNDRGTEWSRSNNTANRGEVFDSSLGLGYDFRFAHETVSLIPLLGVGYNIQRLSITKGNQTLTGCAPVPPFAPGTCGGALGPFDGLASSYRAEWLGPWTGVDAKFDSGRFRFGLSAEYHWDVNYSGVGDWNLRQDLAHPASFEHHATADGAVMEGSVAYRWSERWSGTGRLKWQRWWTAPGNDTANFADGTQASTRLNAVHWESVSASLGASYHF